MNMIMRMFCLYILTYCVLYIPSTYGQLSGVNTINSSGTNFVGDPGSTSGKNYTSFTNAVNALTAYGVSSQVIFNVYADTFVEQINIHAITGASATNTITFQSQNLDSTSVVITFAARSADTNYVVYMNGADDITFNKISIIATGSMYAYALVLCNGADYNTFINDIIQVPIGSTTNYTGIYSNNSIYSILDEYNTIKNNLIIGGCRGIYFNSSASNESGNVIEGNTIKDFYSEGINVSFQKVLSIIRNRIYGLDRSSSLKGIYVYACLYGGDISFNNIQFNSPLATVLQGIVLQNSRGSLSVHGRIFNNIISITGHPVTIISGINVSGDQMALYQDICFNSVNIYPTTTSPQNTNASCISVNNNVTGYTYLSNNIFANFSGGYAISVSHTYALTSSNYNNLFTTGNDIGYWSNSCSNLADWKTKSGKDLNSVSVNPLFFSNTDLHVNTSGLSNKGTFVTGITTDIDGDARSNTTPDIGADEFNLISNDAGINDITAPLPPDSGSNPVYVKIKNFGTSNLSSVVVNWQVNGVLQTPDSVTSLALAQAQEIILNIGSYNFMPGVKYNLKFWTTYPNGFTDGNFRNDTFSYHNLQTGISGIFTIGGSTGLYPSFNAAVSDLIAKGLVGAVKYRVFPGTYNEKVSIPSIIGNSASNTIIFESYNHDSTSVDLNYSASDDGDNYVFQLKGTDYVTVRNIKIRATGNIYGNAVVLWLRSDYITISNNIIISPVRTNYYGFKCIHSIGDDYNKNHITLRNNILYGGNNGIYLSGGINTVQNNIIKDFLDCGIYTSTTRSLVISNNFIQNNPKSNDATGIEMYYGYDTVQITKNKIIVYSPGTNSGLDFRYVNGNINNPVQISNNFIAQTGSSNNASFGIYISYCKNFNIFFNSVHITSNSTNNGFALYQTGGSGLRIINNIFTNSGSGYTINISTPSAITSLNYNNLFTKGAILGKWDTSSSSNLSTWKNKSNRDSNSISIDPLFYSSTDLHSSATGLMGAGKTIPNLTDDIDGDTRNISSPSIGADELRFSNRDGSITSLISPAIPCQGVSSNVIVKLKNFGLDTIKTAKIKWKVNGVNQNTMSLSCNLYLSEDTSIVIGSFTYNKNTTYSIKVWIDTVNSNPDQNHKNDTLVYNDIKTGMGGTYSIGASGKNYSSITAAINDLTNLGVCSPVVFTIDSGNYNEQINLNNIKNSNSINTITFQSASKNNDKAILNYEGTESNNYVIKLTGAKYIKFNNITIQNTSKSFGRVVVLDSNAGYDSFTFNRIIGYDTNLATDPSQLLAIVYSNGTSFANHCQNNIFNYNNIQYGTYSIWFYGYNDGLSTYNNNFDHNTITDYSLTGANLKNLATTRFTNNTITTKYINYSNGISLNYINYSSLINYNIITVASTYIITYGISLNNSSYSNQISKNIIINTGNGDKFGIYLQTCTRGTQVVGNTIEVNSTDRNQYGIFAENFQFEDGITHSEIISNIISLKGITGYTSYGIYYVTSYGSILKNLVANNFIIQANGNAQVFGYYSANSGLTDILYNSISIKNGNTNSHGLFFESYNNSTSYKKNCIMNNISSVTGGGYPIYINNNYNPVSKCDYNDFYKGTGNYVGRWNNTTDCATLSNWQNNSQMDSNSISIDVPFKSTYDLHIGYSNFLGVNNALSEVTSDIDGETRSTTKPIIGADEKPSIENDAGISEIISPVQKSCEGVYPVKVRLVNFSIMNLSSVNIDWSINGVNKTTIHLIISLPYLKDTIINIGMESFSGGVNTIKAHTNLPNGMTDQDQSNDADSVNVKIYSLPVVNFTVIDSTECLRGNVFSFNNKTILDTGTTANYLWKFGDGKTSTVKNPTHSYNAVGNYFAKIIATQNNGCKDSSELKAIHVLTTSKASFAINDSTQCLNGNYYRFIDNSSIQNGVIYSKEWNLGNGTIKKDTNTGYVYKTDGIYNIKLVINSNTSGCSDSISKQIIVFPDPKVNLGLDTIVKDNTKLTLNAGSGFDSCLWSTGANTMQLTIDSSSVGDGVKEIWARVYKNGCMGSDTINITFTPTVNIQKDNSKSNFNIYPNPTRDYIIVRFNVPDLTRINISITNMYGKTVKQVTGEKMISSSFYIDLFEQPAGIYFIRIDTEKNSEVYKLNVIK